MVIGIGCHRDLEWDPGGGTGRRAHLGRGELYHLTRQRGAGAIRAFRASGKPPRAFTIDNPARIALDFADTGLNLADRHRAIGVGPAQSVSAVEAGGRTRVVLNLVRQVPYELRVEGSAVVVTLHSGGAMMPDVRPVRLRRWPRAHGPPARGLYPRGLPAPDRGHRFPPRRGREGRIIVLLSESGLVSNIHEEGGQIIIDFPDARIARASRSAARCTGFCHAGERNRYLRSRGRDPHGHYPSGHYEHLAYQSDKILTVEVKPLTKEEEEAVKKAKVRLYRRKLSLNFQDIEVRAVLQLIADFTGINWSRATR